MFYIVNTAVDWVATDSMELVCVIGPSENIVASTVGKPSLPTPATFVLRAVCIVKSHWVMEQTEHAIVIILALQIVQVVMYLSK